MRYFCLDSDGNAWRKLYDGCTHSDYTCECEEWYTAKQKKDRQDLNEKSFIEADINKIKSIYEHANEDKKRFIIKCLCRMMGELK